VLENKMIDSHCHINDELYRKNPEEYVKIAKISGVFQFLVVGFDKASSVDAVNISKQFDGCYAAVGIHPSDIKKRKENDLEEIKDLAKEKKVIAIGEIGLDYYWDKDEAVKEEQRKYFIEQIKIANELNLPISIHCREAIEDCLQILKENPVKNAGIMHCFAGSVESAKEFIKLGFLLGFGGTVTFKNAVRPKEVVASIPSDSYVLETDAPYLTPDPYRGKENHSKYLYLVKNKIAELRGISPEQVEKETSENFKRVFKI
jgi:TatD DNase family protein